MNNFDPVLAKKITKTGRKTMRKFIKVYYGCICGHTRMRTNGHPKTKCPNCGRLPYLEPLNINRTESL